MQTQSHLLIKIPQKQASFHARRAKVSNSSRTEEKPVNFDIQLKHHGFCLSSSVTKPTRLAVYLFAILEKSEGSGFVIVATPLDKSFVRRTACLLSREKVSTFDRLADIKHNRVRPQRKCTRTRDIPIEQITRFPRSFLILVSPPIN